MRNVDCACPNCKNPLDVMESVPIPEDISICSQCFSYLAFYEHGDDLKLRNMTRDEILELEPEIRTSLQKEQYALIISKRSIQ